MGGRLNLARTIISILAMYSISNQNSKVGAEEVEEAPAYERLEIMMKNKECGKAFPVSLVFLLHTYFLPLLMVFATG